MKRTKKIFWIVSLILSIGGMASAEWPLMPNEPTVEYSADSLEETTGTTSYNFPFKPRSYSGDNSAETSPPTSFTYPTERRMVKVYRAPGKMRREVDRGGEMTIQITRYDKHVSWALMPMQKNYIKMPVPFMSLSDGNEELTELGEEVIDGYQTKKSKLTVTHGQFILFDGFIWTTPENIPIKTEGISVLGGNKIEIKNELKNLKIGAQDPSLFEIPEGYTDIRELLQGSSSTNQEDMR